MGQQQLLLIVLGVVIVGIAVIGGINLFMANAVDSKRAIMTNELVNLASLAQQYYMKPTTYGGGGRKFTGWILPSELTTTATGHYTFQVNPDSAIIIGIGNEVVQGNDSMKIQINVKPTSIRTIIVN